MSTQHYFNAIVTATLALLVVHTVLIWQGLETLARRQFQLSTELTESFKAINKAFENVWKTIRKRGRR